MNKNRLVILTVVVLSVVIATLLLGKEYRYMSNDPYAYFNEDAVIYQYNGGSGTEPMQGNDLTLVKSSTNSGSGFTFVNGSFSSSKVSISSSEMESNSSLPSAGGRPFAGSPTAPMPTLSQPTVGINMPAIVGTLSHKRHITTQNALSGGRQSSRNSEQLGNPMLIGGSNLLLSRNGLYTTSYMIDPGNDGVFGGSLVDPGNDGMGGGSLIDPGHDYDDDVEITSPIDGGVWILLLLALGYGLLRKRQLKNQLTED